MFLGVFSLFFHLTLSEFGQFLDELFIASWIFLMTYIVEVIDNYIILPFAIFIIKPYITRFSLLFIGLYYIYKMCDKLNFEGDSLKVFNIASLQFFVSFVFWVSDMILCPVLPVSLHWMWHIYVALSQHNFVTLIIGNLNKDILEFNFSNSFYITLEIKKTEKELSEIKTLIKDDSDDDDFVQIC
jgi:uncharacterized membrane protein YcgQ (UPF0703/DUF1980 family)